ncbi:uncharacterized protein LOC111480811 [Cucurbita maxima]|uniref:Uncharacterized protein LOC111480811 n=1 Tax=Cucurbita maxima TaxID=3661 RepID=A0A6J1J0I5_CUCMA|nr:uncharacterized protein LOC111480811 [Cucurbita maxima]
MEVLLGSPTFSIEVPSENSSAVAETHNRDGSGFRESGSGSSIGENSSESSSIGVPDDDSDDDDEVQSKLKEGGLLGLDSLEDALVIKGGLSRHFSGKSKSFANLSEVIQVKDLEKPDNPFNKRRRILMASKWSRKASFYSWRNPKSMPLLALNEDEEEQQPADGSDSEERNRESDEDDDQNERRRQTLGQRYHDRKLVNGFKSMSCFDLQEYEQQ